MSEKTLHTTQYSPVLVEEDKIDKHKLLAEFLFWTDFELVICVSDAFDDFCLYSQLLVSWPKE